MQSFTDKSKYKFAHDGQKVTIMINQGRMFLPDDKTGFQADTEQECYDEIERLGLQYDEEDLGDDDGINDS